MESYKAYPCPSVETKKTKGEVIRDLLAGIVSGLRYPPDHEMIKKLRDMERLKVSPRSELRISEEAVLLVDDGIPVKSFSRDSLHIAHFILHKQLYYVFSNLEIESRTVEGLIEMIHQKKAFCFPYVWQAEKDFPEMFKV